MNEKVTLYIYHDIRRMAQIPGSHSQYAPWPEKFPIIVKNIDT